MSYVFKMMIHGIKIQSSAFAKIMPFTKFLVNFIVLRENTVIHSIKFELLPILGTGQNKG